MTIECEHGYLARACERCEDAAEIARLRAELEMVTQERDALLASLARAAQRHAVVQDAALSLISEEQDDHG